MKKKFIILMCLVLSLALFAVACSKPAEKKEDPGKEVEQKADEKKDEPAKEEPAGEKVKIEVIAKGFQHAFWGAVRKGSDQAGQDLNAEVVFQGPESEDAAAEQVGMMNNAIGKKPAAICLAALNTESMMDALVEAKDNKIPIVGFDSGVPDAPEGTIVANASTDNKAAAAIAAEKLFEAVKSKVEAATKDKKVRIGIVSQEVVSASIQGRTNGFVEKMQELLKGLDNVGDKVALTGNDYIDNSDKVKVDDAVVVIQLSVPSEISDGPGQVAAEALFNQEDLIGIYGSNEFSANAIINANEAKGGGLCGKAEDGKIVAVGFDAGKKQKAAVKAGVMIGSVTQDPVQIGYKAVELAVKAAKGEPVEDVDTGAKWYDASNMDEADIAILLYD